MSVCGCRRAPGSANTAGRRTASSTASTRHPAAYMGAALPQRCGTMLVFLLASTGSAGGEGSLSRHPHGADARALWGATSDGDCVRMRSLLDAGVGADEMVESSTKSPVTGELVRSTALLQAVFMNRQDAAELLLEHHADPSLADTGGGTPLMCAAQHGRVSILEKLLQRGVVIDAVDMNGASAFHYACFQGHVDCAEALVKAGCDAGLTAMDGRTGMQLAQDQGHRAVSEMLVRSASREMAVWYACLIWTWIEFNWSFASIEVMTAVFVVVWCAFALFYAIAKEKARTAAVRDSEPVRHKPEARIGAVKQPELEPEPEPSAEQRRCTNHLMKEPPNSFCCPISHEMMVDPVVVVASGQTYERAHIAAWFRTNSTDPVTGMSVGQKRQLAPNATLKALIIQWHETGTVYS